MTTELWAKMGPGVEFDLIRRMAERWGDLVQHAGDDAAILDLKHGARLVASTDTSLEGVHFRREWLSLQEIGYLLPHAVQFYGELDPVEVRARPVPPSGRSLPANSLRRNTIQDSPVRSPGWPRRAGWLKPERPR